MSDGQAPKGGTIGRNGDFYKGGQFLPSTEKPKGKGKGTSYKGRKVEVAPFVWEECPEGMRPLWGRIAALVQYDRETGKAIALEQDEPEIVGLRNMHGAKAVMVYYSNVSKFNRGVRFVPADPVK